MISALAQAWQVLGDGEDLRAAQRAARYVLEGMRRPDGRLHATARAGRAHLDAYLDDYAFMIQGLLDLYESDFDERWLREALALEAILAQRFADQDQGGYFTTADDHEQLLARLKAPHDGALPSGNGVQALNLLRLAELTGDRALAERAERTMQSVGEIMNRYPQAFSQMLLAVDFLAAGPREIAIAGEPASPSLAHPGADAQLVPLLADKTPGPGGARAFVCRNYTCALPAPDPAALRAQLAPSAAS
jgi:uncharacterized protein YyaL (SSP411 family)